LSSLYRGRICWPPRTRPRAASGFAKTWPNSTSTTSASCIQKFFPSIDYAVLGQRLARSIKDPHVLWLCRLIIESSNPQEPVTGYFPGDDLFTATERRRGLPIGNQTSQFFANVYLDALDHFVKERLHCRAYVRYVDDFLLCDDDKRLLGRRREDIREFLVRLRLRLHPTKSQVCPAAQGTELLGFRVFPTHRRLAKAGVRRFRRRLRRMQRSFSLGMLGPDGVRTSIRAWLGHAQHGQTWRVRERLFRERAFCRGQPEQRVDRECGGAL